MLRLSVVGSPGSGKSTFAKFAAKKLGLTRIELDELFWKPGWQQPSKKEFQKIVAECVTSAESSNKNGWVIAGSYSGFLGTKYMERADYVILLHPPHAKVIWRVLRRSTMRLLRRREIFPGCRETINGALIGKKSLLNFAIRHHKDKMIKTQTQMKGMEDKLKIFKSNNSAYEWLDSLS